MMSMNFSDIAIFSNERTDYYFAVFLAELAKVRQKSECKISIWLKKEEHYKS